MINYQELKKLGLSDKEAKLYLTSLQRGPETAPTLAKLSDIVRPTAYVIIDSLVKKGLMSTAEKGKKMYYVAESPNHLLTLVRLQKNELDEKEREIIKLIPELESLANVKGEKPKVRIFEGKEGLDAMKEILLKLKTKEIRVFSPIDELFGLFTEKAHTETLTRRRVERGIKSRVIYTSKRGPVFKETDKLYNRESKFVAPKDFPFKSGIDIYDNNVTFNNFHGKIIGIVIEDEQIAATMKAIFDLLWKKI